MNQENQEIVNEIENNKQTIVDVTSSDDYTDAQVNEIVSQSINNIYELCVLLMESKDVEIAMKYLNDAEMYAKGLLEHRTGMTMRELNDFMIEHSDFGDSDYELYWKIILEKTFEDFESFMFYMERKRLFRKKFYEPRRYCKDGRKGLKRVAEALQRQKNNELRILSISMPSRVGKSTIFIMYLCWKAMRRPNSHSAYGGYSGTLTKGFFKEIMNMMTSIEYSYQEIYERWNPDKTFICDKSMEDTTVNLDTPDRFSTLTCRGADASWIGIIDVSSDGVLAVDDLIRDREHSMSQMRMDKTWQDFCNNMMDRMNVGSSMCLIGTLWSTIDPIMRLEKMYGDHEDCLFLKIPALDENDESNFDYELHGFTTAHYREMRSRLDAPEWRAKFQQDPFVREGLLFPSDNLTYFDGIVPIVSIKRVYSVCDPAFGGGDNVSAPICYELKDGRKLICRWIYDKRTIGFTVPKVMSAYEKEEVAESRIEITGRGILFYEKMIDHQKKNGSPPTKIVGVNAPNRMTKEDKIKGNSDLVMANYEFLAPHAQEIKDVPEGCLYFKRDADYNRAMTDLTMYTAEGKNTHDDAPDSMAQMVIMDKNKRNGQIEVIHMPRGLSL